MAHQRHLSGQTRRDDRLIHLLPKVGFRWRTLYGQKALLPNEDRRQITRHMKTLLPQYTKEHVENAITKMFRVATAKINGPITCSNSEFWGQVKPGVVWLRGMNERDILRFSWKVLSARSVAMEIHDSYLDSNNLTIEEAPMEETKATKAVDAFTAKLRSTQTPAVKNELHPSWITDEFNAGDEESTNAAFQQVGSPFLQIRTIIVPSYC